jgi:hypothetical protein
MHDSYGFISHCIGCLVNKDSLLIIACLCFTKRHVLLTCLAICSTFIDPCRPDRFSLYIYFSFRLFIYEKGDLLTRDIKYSSL